MKTRGGSARIHARRAVGTVVASALLVAVGACGPAGGGAAASREPQGAASPAPDNAASFVGFDDAAFVAWLGGGPDGILYAKLSKEEPCLPVHWRRSSAGLKARTPVHVGEEERSYHPVDLVPVLRVHRGGLDLEVRGLDGDWLEEEGVVFSAPELRLGVLTELSAEAAWYGGEEVGIFAGCADPPRSYTSKAGKVLECQPCSSVERRVVPRPPAGWTYRDATDDETECMTLVGASPAREAYAARLESERLGGFYWRHREKADSPALYRSKEKCRAARHGIDEPLGTGER